eukprot:4736866-Amphidinium_carterae.2
MVDAAFLEAARSACWGPLSKWHCGLDETHHQPSAAVNHTCAQEIAVNGTASRWFTWACVRVATGIFSLPLMRAQVSETCNIVPFAAG